MFYALAQVDKIYMRGAQAGYEQGYHNGFQEGKKGALTKLPYTT